MRGTAVEVRQFLAHFDSTVLVEVTIPTSSELRCECVLVECDGEVLHQKAFHCMSKTDPEWDSIWCPECGTVLMATHGARLTCRCGRRIQSFGNALMIEKSPSIGVEELE